MAFRKTHLAILATLLLVAGLSCKHDPPETLYYQGYPEEIGKIFINKCATAGCHNEKSYTGAGNLRMDSWANLFEGSSNGAVIVPYDTLNSSLLYFINRDTNEGIVLEPTMPKDLPPLSKEEYETIRHWIVQGAPDQDGNIPFASNPDTRQKLYVTQQGCDLMGVIDAEKNIIMRYIPIGKSTQIEAPHYVSFDKDGRYAYTCFYAGQYIQKIDVHTDKIIAEANVGVGLWNVLFLTNDGKKLLVSDLSNSGKVHFVNTDNMQIETTVPSLKSPHGLAANKTNDTFFVTGQIGNFIYRITEKGYKKQISIDGQPITDASKRDPHEIKMTPDFSKYFLTCETSNEVRVMDAYGDTLIKTINVGKKPKEIATSTSKPYMYITCMEDDANPNPKALGSVYVINYNTLEIEEVIYGNFAQPHGITVDEQYQRLYIVSTNRSPNGPSPHHASECGGRNGYYQVYDLNTLKPINNRRYEVTPDPYSIDARFK